jgi:hypothetical protein
MSGGTVVSAGGTEKRASRFMLIGAGLATLVAAVYFLIPLAAQDAADFACMQSVGGDGTYSVQWVPGPPAHWRCSIAPVDGQARETDIGWWPATR